MTTEAPPARATPMVAGLGLASTAVTLTCGLVAALGAVTTGQAAALGALVGGLLVVVFFSFGAVSVNLVAAIAPRASLLVALMTYTLQVMLLALVLVGIARSELAPGTLDPRWIGGTVMVGTIVWMAGLVVGTVRSTPTGETAHDSAPGEAEVR